MTGNSDGHFKIQMEFNFTYEYHDRFINHTDDALQSGSATIALPMCVTIFFVGGTRWNVRKRDVSNLTINKSFIF